MDEHSNRIHYDSIDEILMNLTAELDEISNNTFSDRIDENSMSLFSSQIASPKSDSEMLESFPDDVQAVKIANDYFKSKNLFSDYGFDCIHFSDEDTDSLYLKNSNLDPPSYADCVKKKHSSEKRSVAPSRTSSAGKTENLNKVQVKSETTFVKSLEKRVSNLDCLDDFDNDLGTDVIRINQSTACKHVNNNSRNDENANKRKSVTPQERNCINTKAKNKNNKNSNAVPSNNTASGDRKTDVQITTELDHKVEAAELTEVKPKNTKNRNCTKTEIHKPASSNAKNTKLTEEKPKNRNSNKTNVYDPPSSKAKHTKLTEEKPKNKVNYNSNINVNHKSASQSSKPDFNGRTTHSKKKKKNVRHSKKQPALSTFERFTAFAGIYLEMLLILLGSSVEKIQLLSSREGDWSSRRFSLQSVLSFFEKLVPVIVTYVEVIVTLLGSGMKMVAWTAGLVIALLHLVIKLLLCLPILVLWVILTAVELIYRVAKHLFPFVVLWICILIMKFIILVLRWGGYTNIREYHRGPGYPQNITLPTDEQVAVRRLLACRGKDPYRVLGVTSDASEDDIKKYFRKQAFLVHPDKNRMVGAEEAFKILVSAYDLIGESGNREDYDQRTSDGGDTTILTHCFKCDGKHKRTATDRPQTSARYCGECDTYHGTKNGDLWLETSMWGLVKCYYICLNGAVFDVTDWAICQGGRFQQLRANCHTVQIRLMGDWSDEFSY